MFVKWRVQQPCLPVRPWMGRRWLCSPSRRERGTVPKERSLRSRPGPVRTVDVGRQLYLGQHYTALAPVCNRDCRQAVRVAQLARAQHCDARYSKDLVGAVHEAKHCNTAASAQPASHTSWLQVVHISHRKRCRKQVPAARLQRNVATNANIHRCNHENRGAINPIDHSGGGSCNIPR